DGELAARRAADMSGDADEVAEIQELHEGELLGVEELLVAEDLNLARGIVEVDEHAAIAVGADAAGQGDLVRRRRAGRQLGIFALGLPRQVAALETVGEGVDPLGLERLQLLQPDAAKLVLFRHYPASPSPPDPRAARLFLSGAFVMGSSGIGKARE